LFIRYIYYWNVHILDNVIIIKTNVLLPQALMDFTDLAIPFRPYSLLPPKDFYIIWLSHLFIMSVPDEGYYKATRAH
jgi:hypothetical protein